MSEKTKSEQNADTIALMVNSFSFNPKEVCKAMCNEHRTLQQTFTRLCIEWLKTCASDNYRYDGRNEDSHAVAKNIDELLTERGLTWDDLYLRFV